MEIVYKGIGEIRPYENNPRKNDGAVDAVAASIREFGWKVPVVIDKDGVIVAGHTRYKAAQKLGIERIPCIVADDLTEEQVRAYRLADNKVGELATWDLDALSEELGQLDFSGIDMMEFGFGDIEIDEDVEDSEREEKEKYSREVKIPHYEPKDEDISVPELFDDSKYHELMQEIVDAKNELSEEEFDFLMLAAHRHIVFDFDRIADYYAKASKKVQELMEHSALVIIDYNDAIANGYAILSQALEDMMEQDNA